MNSVDTMDHEFTFYSGNVDWNIGNLKIKTLSILRAAYLLVARRSDHTEECISSAETTAS